MIKLTLTEKGGEPKLLTFDKDEITIGRVSGNDIVLAKGNVSKRHSRFTARSGGQIEVADLKSTNGTYVNGRKIAAPTVLAASDRVYVGDFLITVDLGGAAAHEDLGEDGVGQESGRHDDGRHGSSSRRLPVPPPPPPPRGTGSRSAPLPSDEESASGGYGDEDDDLGLAARPPRSGRMPLPPPPPPRRPPTPLGSRSLDHLQEREDDSLDLPPAPAAEEDTGSVGLFAHSRPVDEEVSRRVAIGRPGAAAAPAAPAFAAAPAAATGPVGGTTDVGSAAGLDALLADGSVRQILITAPDAALVDRGSGLALHGAGLGDPNAVADALWRLANTAFPPPAPDNPVVDVRLPDGTRFSAAFPPASPGGVVASIRRPTIVERTLADLLPVASRDAEPLLAGVIAARRNLLLTGDPGALAHALGAAAAAIPADRRVVAIGAGQPRSRGGWIDLAPSADAAGLVRVAAGFRAEHLVVGELAGPEAGELALLAARGHDGLIVALAGRSPAEALSHLGALVALGLGSSTASTPLAASAFDLVVQVIAVGEGDARIVEIAEPVLGAAGIEASPVLAYAGDHRDSGSGRLQGRGVSARLAGALAAAGQPLPPALVGT
ncbi:MAG TPA: FHA domain-containing protein [Polyangia bacterium]|nr:FHA domain-containing protein [Polyangia bacterium]